MGGFWWTRYILNNNNGNLHKRLALDDWGNELLRRKV